MKPSIAAKLAQLSTRLEEITRLLGQENVTADPDNHRQLAREHGGVRPVVELYQRYAQGEADLQAAQDMTSDPGMREFAESEIKQTRERLAGIEQEIQKKLL